MNKKKIRNINFYHTPKLFKFWCGRNLVIYPFGVFYKYRTSILNNIILNQCEIQYQQQRELFVVFYLLLFLIEYLVRLFINGEDAFSHVSFIREKNTHRNSAYYYKNRKQYSFMKYLFMI